jgi:hypothetical protein
MSVVFFFSSLVQEVDEDRYQNAAVRQAVSLPEAKRDRRAAIELRVLERPEQPCGQPHHQIPV